MATCCVNWSVKVNLDFSEFRWFPFDLLSFQIHFFIFHLNSLPVVVKNTTIKRRIRINHGCVTNDMKVKDYRAHINDYFAPIFLHVNAMRVLLRRLFWPAKVQYFQQSDFSYRGAHSSFRATQNGKSSPLLYAMISTIYSLHLIWFPMQHNFGHHLQIKNLATSFCTFIVKFGICSTFC